MVILEAEHISKNFERTEVLKDISFSLEKGQVLSIIGSSGSGKTTLLRCLNFLEKPDGGVIRVKGERARRAKSAERGFISVWYSSPLTCSRSIRLLRT